MKADHMRRVLCIGDSALVTGNMRQTLLRNDIDINVVPEIESGNTSAIFCGSARPDLIIIADGESDANGINSFKSFLEYAPVMFISAGTAEEGQEKILTTLTRLFSAKGGISSRAADSESVFDIDILQTAFENNEFVLWYQPIISRSTGSVSGFESLIRWNHSSRCEIILPDHFMPTIEKYDFIIPFGFWIIEQACRQLKMWQEFYTAGPPVCLSINLSARQFSCPELCERIISIIDQVGIDPSMIALEITESAFMEDMETANLVLLKLKAKKIKIYLDDFGTGFASLSYLLHFPVDVIKIDKSFVKWMHVDEQSEEIVRSVVMLAHNLKMKVVAEGVESEEHLEKLREFGCDYLQGFYFAKPLAHDDAAMFMETCRENPLFGGVR